MKPRLAREIGIELLGASFELARAFGRAARLALEVFLLDLETRERRSLHRFGFAKRRQSFGKAKLFVEGLGFGFRRRAEAHHRIGQLRLLVLDALLRVLPSQMQGERFLLTDVVRQLLVAPRLPRLPLQRFRLRLKLPDDIVQPLDVGFGRLELEFRFVAARVQSRDAGCVFEDAPALLGLGIDESRRSAPAARAPASALRSRRLRTKL